MSSPQDQVSRDRSQTLRWGLGLWSGLLFTLAAVGTANGFGFFDGTGTSGLAGGSRWEAAPRTMSGMERSLSGGLRFSLQGGSYQAYRDLLAWNGTPPSVAEFEQAVLQAFAVWTATDPVTGLDTNVRFVPDLATATSTAFSGNVRLGAEIDIMVSMDGNLWNPGDSGTRAETFFNAIGVAGNLTLASGVTGYAGFAISGADVTFNNNSGARYTLATFKTILAHEIGHALGLADVDVTSGPAGTYVDDNYNGTSAATILATLTNPFALLINPANPGASPLRRYTVPNASPGIDTAGVDILMESSIPSIYFGAAGPSMSADDVAGRQFLYPVAPAPTLAISMDGTDVVLSWQDSPGWRPWRSATLLADSWSVIGTTGSLQDGTRVVRLTKTESREFYRLQRFAP
ncbi:MAG: hypothetical protein ACRCXD_12175 [Luteolibacter sp.]